MTREEFMVKARDTARKIFDGKENGIMNLVQQAWAEGKRNAEVEALKEAVMVAFNASTITDRSSEIGYEEPREPVYPTWAEYLKSINLFDEHVSDYAIVKKLRTERVSADTAQKIGINPH